MGISTALTEPGIQRIAKAPAGTRVEKFDRLAPGLCLRISDKGRKTWIGHYRLNGRSCKIALGAWPSVKVDEARRAMREVRAQAEAGGDPKDARARDAAQARAAAEAPETFQAVAEGFIAREVPKLKRGREYESVIRNRLLPAWRDKPLAVFRKRDAIRLTDALVDQGHAAAALKLHEVIRRVFNWAVDRDRIDVNPFANLKPPAKKQPRQRALTHAEIQALWRVAAGEGYPWGAIIQLLLLTGQRRGEVAGLRWQELDDAERPAVWTIPAERSKSGRPHRVPLSPPASAILASLPRIAQPGTGTADCVFTTTGRTPVSGFSKTATRVRAQVMTLAQEAGLDVELDFRWHDMRRTVRSELSRLGVDTPVSERVLNHAGDWLERTYDVYKYETEKREALDRWAAELLTLVGDQDAAPGPARRRALLQPRPLLEVARSEPGAAG